VKKFRRVLALALLLAMSLFTLAIAQEAAEQSEILIDSSRNAALKFKSQDSAKDVTGTFNLGGDIVKGIVAGKVDLKFTPETQKQLGDAQGALYYNLTDLMEIIGNVDMTLPAEAGKDLQKLEGDIESVLSENKAYAKGDFDLQAATADAVPAVNVDFNAKGDTKTFDGGLNFDVDATAMGETPFKEFQFGITEAEAGKTQFDIEVAVDAKSPYAAQLKQLGANPDAIKQGITQQLAQANIQVESVTLGEYKEENGAASAKLTVVLKEWRNVVKSAAGMMGGGKIDAAKMTEAVGKMLDAKFDSVTIDVKMDGKKLKGVTKAKVTNMREFLLGYYQLMAMVSEAQLKDQGDGDDATQRFVLAYQAVAMEESQKAMQAIIDAEMGFEGKGKFTMAGQGGAGEAGATPEGNSSNSVVKAEGEFDFQFTNYGAYMAKASAAGIPAGKSNAMKLDVKMSDKQKLTGTLYAYSDAKIINYYKALLLNTAKKAGAPADALAAAEKVEFKGGAGSFNMNKDGIVGSNFLESTDLSPLVKVGLDAVAKDQFTGQLVGFNVDGKTEGDKMNIEGTVNFTKFMEGKSADDIKSAFGVDKVTEGAKADQVTLVAVNKPEVSMPGGLSAVAAEGKGLIASNPMAAVTGALGGGGKGGNNLLYILGGLAALGVVGVGLAAGRKKG
jgi:hypothetical protein